MNMNCDEGPPERQPASSLPDHSHSIPVESRDVPESPQTHQDALNTAIHSQSNGIPSDVVEEMTPAINRITAEEYRRYKRKQFRTSLLLFLATCFSTFLVASEFLPLVWSPGFFSSDFREYANAELQRSAARTGTRPMSFQEVMGKAIRNGLEYSVPLMLILLCHELGHFLQAVRYRVPASLPYFIPLPLPPLGTMGAVILQGRGVANRKQMFDIAVSGPLAGLLITLPVLFYGIRTSEFRPAFAIQSGLEFGEPMLLTWLIEWLHHPAGENQVFILNGYGFAGWVGVFITSMNLLPIGQLDGGHILYTLIGRKAHYVAYGVLLTGVAFMLYTRTVSYMLLIILLMLTGTRHPPTSDDSMPIGWKRHAIGWMTMSFLLIGFTPNPIIIEDAPKPSAPAQQTSQEQIALRFPSSDGSMSSDSNI
ncbi:MAG: site-2 protease family protein [Planctomycetaceae bacterium]